MLERLFPSRSRARMALGIAALIAAGGSPQPLAFAQTAPVFEVRAASAVREPGRSCSNASNAARTPQTLALQSWLLGDIIAFAHELPLDRIERRPQWTYEQCYDVAVSTSAPASLDEQKRMLRALLEERFQLIAHRNSYPSPVYFLVRGPEVKLTEEAAPDEEFFLYPQSAGPVYSHLYAPSVGDLAAVLGQHLQLPVVDRTGITGLFGIRVGLPVRITESGIGAAIRSSVGLELERRQGAAESLIIDRVEQPLHSTPQ